MSLSACPYRRIRPIGEGAVGDVHLCVDLERRRLVVVKWLRSGIDQHSDAALRFEREAQVMLQMRFPGLIRVDGYGRDDYGRTWMAMEFVDGLMPSAAIAPGDAWSVHRFVQGVGSTLDELHGIGVVHRDLKPDNVLVRDAAGGWEPIILDLGIAKWLALDTATATGTVFGTPFYMSPEQFRDSKHVGPATDRYAVAVMAFELLAGRVPFDGKTVVALMQKHLEEPVPRLQVPDPNDGRLRKAPRCDAFMRTAMAKDPSARFGSASEMAHAFEAACKADGFWKTPAAVPSLFPRRETTRVVLTGPDGTTRIFDLADGPVVLGRHENAQFPLLASRLSRMHACLYMHRGQLWAADLESQNGSALDGRALEARAPQPICENGRLSRLRLYDQEVVIENV